MENLFAPSTITELLNRYNLAPLKKLGQNFLKDEHVVNTIAEAAVPDGGYVLEIGPGLGVLTHALAKRAGKVVAVELDAGMVRVLSDTLSEHQNVTILHQDALKCDLRRIGEEYFGGKPFSVVGNLPYYITSKLLLHVLESGAPVTALTVMVQKEVAERLNAQPGTAEYGALTASVAYFGNTERICSVSRDCFLPAPDVDSAVVRLLPKPAVTASRKTYVRVVRGLFAQRRKTLLNNLKREFSLSSDTANSILVSCGLDPNCRAETLSREQFSALANILDTL